MAFLPPDSAMASAWFSIISDPEACEKRLSALWAAEKAATDAKQAAQDAQIALDAEKQSFATRVAQSEKELTGKHEKANTALSDLTAAQARTSDLEGRLQKKLTDLDFVLPRKEADLNNRETAVSAREKLITEREVTADAVKQLAQTVQADCVKKLSALKAILD